MWVSSQILPRNIRSLLHDLKEFEESQAAIRETVSLKDMKNGNPRN